MNLPPLEPLNPLSKLKPYQRVLLSRMINTKEARLPVPQITSIDKMRMPKGNSAELRLTDECPLLNEYA